MSKDQDELIEEYAEELTKDEMNFLSEYIESDLGQYEVDAMNSHCDLLSSFASDLRKIIAKEIDR